MTIKSILCIFNGSQDELNALNTAFMLGKTYGAQIRVLHISSDPAAYGGIYGEGIIASGAIIGAIEKENAQRMSKAREHVTAFAAKHQVPLDAPESPTHQTSVKFVHLIGMMDATIAREGRLSDLIIIGREVPPIHDLITPALFNTGRPVLFIPPAHEGLSSEWKTGAFAWNGSLQAARALYNALPLLRRTEKLYVLTVEKHGRAYDLEEKTALMEYLRTQGITAQSIVVAAGKYRTAEEALLARAKDFKADLLVMGAYGHSMVREMVLGGMTEYMLQNADLPLLLSH